MISPVMDTGDGIGFKGGVGSGDLGRQSECRHLVNSCIFFVTIQPIKRYHKPLLSTSAISLYS